MRIRAFAAAATRRCAAAAAPLCLTALIVLALEASPPARAGAQCAPGYPINDVPPEVTGDPFVGGVLTTTTGEWHACDGIDDYSYEWLRDGAAISGAWEPSYVVTAADAGHELRSRVTAYSLSMQHRNALSNVVAILAEDPGETDASEAPSFSDAEPVEAPDPDEVESNDPESPDDSGDIGGGFGTFSTPAVTWSSNNDMFKFRNADGWWTIYKRCFDRVVPGVPPAPSTRKNVGIGYIAHFKSGSRVLVNDYLTRSTAADQPGYLNAVHGGLGTFGWHHTRGPIDATPAGDDPTTPAVTENAHPTARPTPGYAVEGRMCAASNGGYGIYARSWKGPSRVSNTHVAFTIDVWFRDPAINTGHGPDMSGNGVGDALARVRYRYSFYKSSVRSWISVLLYPRSNAGGVPFVKEPKFAATLQGQHVNFRRMAIFGGEQGETFHQGVLRGGQEGVSGLLTEHSSLPGRVRVRWDYGTSLVAEGASPCDEAACFNAVMRAYPTAANGDILRTCDGCQPARVPIPWENTQTLGLDRWARVSANRAQTWARDTDGGEGQITSCNAPFLEGEDQQDPVDRSVASERSNPGIDGVRTWEHAGWKPSVNGTYPENNQNRFTAAMTLFLGWKGGRGPADCEPLERAFPSGQESWGSFAIYSVGSGWERLR
jgi:hypothetical protein